MAEALTEANVALGAPPRPDHVHSRRVLIYGLLPTPADTVSLIVCHATQILVSTPQVKSGGWVTDASIGPNSLPLKQEEKIRLFLQKK